MDAIPEEVRTDRRPGRWAWPAILLAPVLMLGSEWLVPAAEREAEIQHDTSLLALLQVQAKVVIALGVTDVAEARKQLATLEEQAGTDEMAAALALTHGFLGLEKGGSDAVELLLAGRAEAPGADAAFLESARQAALKGVDDSGREALRERVGWFANLAGEAGAPSEVPGGDGIRTGAMIQLIVLGLFGLAAIIAVFLGAGLLLYAEIRRADGRFHRAFDPARRPSGLYLEVFAIFLLGMSLGNLAGWLLHWALQPVISLGGLLLALRWPKRHGVTWADTRRALGLHRGRGWWREIGAGVVCYFCLLPMAVMGIALSMGLVAVVRGLATLGATLESVESGSTGGVATEPATHPAVGWMLGGWEAKVMVVILAAVLAPLIEEVFFRGAFIRYLRGRFRFVIAGMLNGLLFAALHPQGWMAIPALTMMGFGFACFREWRDSLIAPMTAHAINNGALIGILALVLT